MTWLSDAALEHLRDVADWPDLSGTRYELVDRLGRGGMGAVYLARDRELDRQVALKVLDAPRPTPEAEARLLREARVLARLEHPGIVPVHDVGWLPDGRLFYTMKRVKGSRLDDVASAGGSVPELLRVFERICEAVAFAHARRVIHRDLKPENVMVGDFGEVLVLDWGVAKLLDEASGALAAEHDGQPARVPGAGRDGAPVTTGGTVLGTPGYMAPEQSRGEVERVDARADVYALGALLDFLLRRGARESGTGDAGRPVGANTRPRGIPRQLEAIRRKALAEDPDQRYDSVLALAADVSRFEAGLSVSAYPETLLDRARRLFARYRTPILLVVAYLVMRLALLLFESR
jgi:serine/threonine protein kinase